MSEQDRLSQAKLGRLAAEANLGKAQNTFLNRGFDLSSTAAPFAPKDGSKLSLPGLPQKLAPRPSDGTFVVAIDEPALKRNEPNFFRFCANNETIDVQHTNRFLLVSPKDLDAMVGHPVLLSPDGLPILGDDDRKVVAAGLAIRHRVTDNPNLSRKQKRRTIESLRDESMIGDDGMVPPQVQDVEGLRLPKYRVTEMRESADKSEGTKLNFDEKLATFDKRDVERLIGRKIGRTPDGQYDDLTESECQFLGTALGGLEELRLCHENLSTHRADYVIHETSKVIFAEWGREAAQRVLAFMRRDNLRAAAGLRDEAIDLSRQKTALEDMATFTAETNARPPRLERPDGSAFHKVQEACRARDIMPLFINTRLPERLSDAFDGVAHAFVVEHDWATAFKGSTDFDAGDVALPFPICAFEFQILGRRVAVILQEHETEPTVALLFIYSPVASSWVLPSTYQYASGKMKPTLYGPTHNEAISKFQSIADLVGANLRAISITLEAEITKTEIVRIDHRLNRAREKRGKLPLNDYHVVSLAHRNRYLPRAEPLDPDREYTRRRLHFRRGHFRHYPTYKIWVKWCLAGDPDLGFIEKHYRL